MLAACQRLALLLLLSQPEFDVTVIPLCVDGCSESLSQRDVLTRLCEKTKQGQAVFTWAAKIDLQTSLMLPAKRKNMHRPHVQSYETKVMILLSTKSLTYYLQIERQMS